MISKNIRNRHGVISEENPIKVYPCGTGMWVAWFGASPEIGPCGYGSSIESAIEELQDNPDLYLYLNGATFSINCEGCGVQIEYRHLLPHSCSANWGLECTECGHLNVLSLGEIPDDDTEDEEIEGV